MAAVAKMEMVDVMIEISLKATGIGIACTVGERGEGNRCAQDKSACGAHDHFLLQWF